MGKDCLISNKTHFGMEWKNKLTRSLCTNALCSTPLEGENVKRVISLLRATRLEVSCCGGYWLNPFLSPTPLYG